MLPPISVNKILLEHSEFHSFAYCYGCFHTKIRVNCDRDSLAPSIHKYLLKKHLMTPLDQYFCKFKDFVYLGSGL